MADSLNTLLEVAVPVPGADIDKRPGSFILAANEVNPVGEKLNIATAGDVINKAGLQLNSSEDGGIKPPPANETVRVDLTSEDELKIDALEGDMKSVEKTANGLRIVFEDDGILMIYTSTNSAKSVISKMTLKDGVFNLSSSTANFQSSTTSLVLTPVSLPPAPIKQVFSQILETNTTTQLVQIDPEPLQTLPEQPPTVTLSSSSTSMAENAGNVTVTATLSKVYTQAVTVGLAYSGTGTSSTDYSNSGTIITIAAGAKTGSVTLTGVDDSLDDDNETIVVDVSSVTNGTENGTQQQTVYITDDDTKPTATLSLSSSSLTEGASTVTISVTLSAVSGQDVTVYLTFSGTATSGGEDYSVSATTITIAAGSTTGTSTITVIEDSYDEDNETVIVTISSVTNASESGPKTLTVVDDDSAPTVTLTSTSSSISEGSGSTILTATLSAQSSNDVTVALAYSGTATSGGTDYTYGATSITINAGSTSGTITLTLVDDTLDESSETIIVDISSVTNGTESSTQQVTTTIADNDDAPTVSLSTSSTALAEAGGSATLTATLSAASSNDVTVALSYSGTATSGGTDYTYGATSITISAGSTTGSTTITSVDDTSNDDSETIIVDISSVTNGSESGTQQVNATITDDDLPTVTLSLNDTTLAEDGGVGIVTATLSEVSTSAVTVTLSYSGTATGSGTDYTASSSTITIAAGSTTGTATITSVDDAIKDISETVIVDIASVTSTYSESGTQQVTATITDDSVVVFDMVGGNNSSHSSRTFAAGTSYTIYFKVNSTSHNLLESGSNWGQWTGGANLGADDVIILAGSGANIKGRSNGIVDRITRNANTFIWNTSASQSTAFQIVKHGQIVRYYNVKTGNLDTANNRIWNGSNWASSPNNGKVLGSIYLTAMPSKIMTSQGLT
ncbi:MAG: hypothetical protein HQL71_12925 [Magnetococcales bacterium]|nr:hypothetical protein [Magnetococcales bacterium]